MPSSLASTSLFLEVDNLGDFVCFVYEYMVLFNEHIRFSGISSESGNFLPMKLLSCFCSSRKSYTLDLQRRALELPWEVGRSFLLSRLSESPSKVAFYRRSLIKASKVEYNSLNVSLCKQGGLNEI